MKNLGTFWQNFSKWIFVFYVLIYLRKEFRFYLNWFLLIALQIYREILKKYRKRTITPHKNIEKTVLDIHTRNVMAKLESSRLNGVAVIVETHKHTSMLSWIMVKPFTLWDSNFGESFLLWISNKCNFYFFEKMYISRDIAFSVLLQTEVKARRRRYLEKYTFFQKNKNYTC